MNHRESHHVGSNLGDSTSCLLTFQLDEDIDIELYKMTLTNDAKRRSTTAYRVRNDEVVQTRCAKSRSSTAYRVRGDDSIQTSSCKPRSSTAHRMRQNDMPTGKPLSRTKSETITETSSTRSKSVTTSRNTYHDSDSTSPTSVTSATEFTIHPRSSGPIETVFSKPKEYHRPRPPAGRARPVIRTHRSGSFALRQFKETHDQTQNRRSKTKTEARSRGSMTNQTIDVASENSTEWVKPPLRPYHSVDGSFCLLYCSGETINEASNETSPGLDHRFKEYNGVTKYTRSMVEVAPGYSALMCGIDETMNALHLDRIIHAECTSCNTFLACINVASMVLCPGCQTVSPLESPGHSFDCVPIMGLGLRIKDILAQSAGK